MGYMLDLDEYEEKELADELARRQLRRENGLCDYCGNKAGVSILRHKQDTYGPDYPYAATDGPCKFPVRHGVIPASQYAVYRSLIERDPEAAKQTRHQWEIAAGGYG